MKLRAFLAGIVMVALMVGCIVGDPNANTNATDAGSDDPDAVVAEKQWLPITNVDMGLVQGNTFQLDAQVRINAVVAGSLKYWDNGAWMLLAAPPVDVTIDTFRIKNGAIFALLVTPAGKQICEYIAGVWQPRTPIGPAYAGGFTIFGQAPQTIYAVIADVGGHQISMCNIDACTPKTPIAPISTLDFDCDGCGGGGGGGTKVFWSQLGTQVCSSTNNAAWVPQTSEVTGLGPQIHTEPRLAVEIDDSICEYNTETSTFDVITSAFANMTHFEMNPAGTWLALADGVVCEYK